MYDDEISDAEEFWNMEDPDFYGKPWGPGNCEDCNHCQTINDDRDIYCHKKDCLVNGDPCDDFNDSDW